MGGCKACACACASAFEITCNTMCLRVYVSVYPCLPIYLPIDRSSIIKHGCNTKYYLDRATCNHLSVTVGGLLIPSNLVQVLASLVAIAASESAVSESFVAVAALASGAAASVSAGTEVRVGLGKAPNSNCTKFTHAVYAAVAKRHQGRDMDAYTYSDDARTCNTSEAVSCQAPHRSKRKRGWRRWP